MKEGWTYKKLGEVGTFERGGGFVKSDFVENGFPCIHYGQIHTVLGVTTAKNLTYIPNTLAPNKCKIAKPGDVILAITSEDVEGNCKCTAWIGNSDVAVGGHTAIFHHSLYPAFVAYYFRGGYFQQAKERYAHGFKVVEIKPTDIASIQIAYPPLSEQERIVSELDLLTEIIDKQKAQLKELDTLAQSIFYDMFGDPVLNDKGWKKKKINQIAEGKLSYGSGSSAAPFDGCVRYIRITDIGDDGKLRNDIVSPSVFDEKYILNDGDILFARTGATVGKTYLHKKENGKCIYAGYLIKLVPNKSFVLPDYVYGFTKTAYYKSFVDLAQKAVAQPNINAEQYGNLEIPLPPLSLQQSFADKVSAIEQQKAAIGRSIAETQQLFDYTMDKYFG